MRIYASEKSFAKRFSYSRKRHVLTSNLDLDILFSELAAKLVVGRVVEANVEL